MRAAYLTGSCRTGAERDRGRVIHAISDAAAAQAENCGSWHRAACGATPGRTSAGWEPTTEAVTCAACRRALLSTPEGGRIMDSMGALILVPHELTAEQEARLEELGAGRLVADAAELGLQPGRWPGLIATTRGNGQPLALREVDRHGVAHYAQAGSRLTLEIIND